MKKRILLIGYNFSPESTGIGKYSGEMIHWLADNGYDCTVITTYPYYPHWKVQEPYSKRRLWYTKEHASFASGGKITIHRCPMYVPANPSGMKRVLLDLSFLISASFKLLQIIPTKKFDFVFTIAPSFQFGLLGIFYKFIRGSKIVYHIQDMQIEAARDLQLIKSEKALRFLFKVEKYIMQKSDIISSISTDMVCKISEKAGKPVLLFPNWANIAHFYPIEDKASLKEEFGFKKTDKILLYSGAIGEKQGLEIILHAANEYKNDLNVKFIICGSGPYKKKLQALATKLNLSNVLFFPLQPLDKFCKFLNTADVHLVIQKADASDLVMPSKLTTILAVGGLALITANEGSGLYSLAKKHNIALVVEAENQQAFNEKVRIAMHENNASITKNARLYSEQYLSIENIMQNLENEVALHTTE